MVCHIFALVLQTRWAKMGYGATDTVGKNGLWCYRHGVQSLHNPIALTHFHWCFDEESDLSLCKYLPKCFNLLRLRGIVWTSFSDENSSDPKSDCIYHFPIDLEQQTGTAPSGRKGKEKSVL